MKMFDIVERVYVLDDSNLSLFARTQMVVLPIECNGRDESKICHV